LCKPQRFRIGFVAWGEGEGADFNEGRSLPPDWRAHSRRGVANVTASMPYMITFDEGATGLLVIAVLPRE
jgi:hypothetical protein